MRYLAAFVTLPSPDTYPELHSQNLPTRSKAHQLKPHDLNGIPTKL